MKYIVELEASTLIEVEAENEEDAQAQAVADAESPLTRWRVTAIGKIKLSTK